MNRTKAAFSTFLYKKVENKILLTVHFPLAENLEGKKKEFQV